MPWKFSDIIDRVSDGQPCHHCAIICPHPTWVEAPDSEAWVYEAWVPESRVMPWLAYRDHMHEWASNWRYNRGREPFWCEVMRGSLGDIKTAKLHAAAQAMLAVKYNMVINYLSDRPSYHCSELAARATVAAGITTRWDYVDKHGGWLNLARVTPWMWYNSLIGAGMSPAAVLKKEDLA